MDTIKINYKDLIKDYMGFVESLVQLKRENMSYLLGVDVDSSLGVPVHLMVAMMPMSVHMTRAVCGVGMALLLPCLFGWLPSHRGNYSAKFKSYYQSLRYRLSQILHKPRQ